MMTIEEIKKELAILEVKTGLTESEVRHREQMKVVLGALEDATGSTGTVPAGKEGDKMFPQEYVKEVREEAKGYRTTLRTVEAELAMAKAQLGSIDKDDYESLKAERSEQIRLQEVAEIDRRKKEGEFDQLLLEARATGESAVATTKAEYESQISGLQDRIAQFEKENQTLFFADEYNRAVADANLEIRDHEGLRLRLEREQALEVDDNGQKRIILKDSSGKIMLDDSGENLTLEGRLKQYHSDEVTSYMFSSQRQAVGSSTAQARQVLPKGNEIDYFTTTNWNVAEQTRIMKEDPERYNALFAQAMKM
jgi:hypothetical protein